MNDIIKIDTINDEEHYIIYVNDKELFRIGKRINKLENLVSHYQKLGQVEVVKE